MSVDVTRGTLGRLSLHDKAATHVALILDFGPKIASIDCLVLAWILSEITRLVTIHPKSRGTTVSKQGIVHFLMNNGTSVSGGILQYSGAPFCCRARINRTDEFSSSVLNDNISVVSLFSKDYLGRLCGDW